MVWRPRVSSSRELNQGRGQGALYCRPQLAKAAAVFCFGTTRKCPMRGSPGGPGGKGKELRRFAEAMKSEASVIRPITTARGFKRGSITTRLSRQQDAKTL